MVSLVTYIVKAANVWRPARRAGVSGRARPGLVFWATRHAKSVFCRTCFLLKTCSLLVKCLKPSIHAGLRGAGRPASASKRPASASKRPASASKRPASASKRPASASAGLLQRQARCSNVRRAAPTSGALLQRQARCSNVNKKPPEGGFLLRASLEWLAVCRFALESNTPHRPWPRSRS